MTLPMVPIDHGVPLPPPRKGSGKWKHRRRYPWRQMKPGDSFFASCDGDDPYRLLRTLRTSVSTVKGAGSYAMRFVDGGVRVWRTA